MTNYEKQKNMTIEEMAEFNVGGGEEIGYLTSDYKIFSNEKDAIKHEIDWLSSEE